MSIRLVAIVAAVAACGDDVTITRIPGSPTATRALTFFDDGQPIAIGGTSEFGLAYLQTPDGDAWTRAAGIPAFDASAKLLRGASDIFAIGETQVHRWERANAGGGFAWRSISIPFGTTANTAFGVDRLGHIFALELLPDGAGAVWRWRTDTNRWQEIPASRPIGVGATQFTISETGNSVAWSVPGVGIAWVHGETRVDIPCEDAAFGACTADVRGLAFKGDESLSALVCDTEINGIRSLVQMTTSGLGRTYEFRDEACRSLSSVTYGTLLVVADSVLIFQDPDEGLVPMTDADPTLTYTLFDPSTAFAFGDGIYRIDF